MRSRSPGRAFGEPTSARLPRTAGTGQKTIAIAPLPSGVGQRPGAWAALVQARV